MARDVRPKRARGDVRGVSAGVVGGEKNVRRAGIRRPTSTSEIFPHYPYFRAPCDTCGAAVGVRDPDEVVHFFNAFPTNAEPFRRVRET